MFYREDQPDVVTGETGVGEKRKKNIRHIQGINEYKRKRKEMIGK